MSEAFFWIGVAHVAAYACVGLIQAAAFVVWWTHKRTGFLRRIMEWHYARLRWNERHERGLSDAEWKRGEPRP